MKKAFKSLLFLPLLASLFSCSNNNNVDSKINSLLVSKESFSSISIYENIYSNISFKEDSPLKENLLYDKIASYLIKNNYDKSRSTLVNKENGEELTNIYTGIYIVIFNKGEDNTKIFVCKDGYTYLSKKDFDTIAFNSTSSLYCYLYSYIK